MSDEQTSNSQPESLVVRDEQPGDIPTIAPYGRRMLTLDEGEKKMAEVIQARQELARRVQARIQPQVAPTEGEEQKRLREIREADVVEAARRSQAEIRRHVDSYLKEHFEHIVSDVAVVITKRATEAVVKGIAGMQEQQMISLDRIAANVRSQIRVFFRDGFAPPKTPSKARRASRKTRKRAERRS